MKAKRRSWRIMAGMTYHIKRKSRLASYITLWWLMVVCLYDAHCQDAKLPAFYPTAEHTYGIKEGLPDMVVEKVFPDKSDRLNLHYYTGRVSSKWLYEYYGGWAYPADLELKDKINGVFIQLICSSGQIYGFQHNKDGHSLVLSYDPLKRATKTIDIDRFGHSSVAAEGALFALASPTWDSDSLEILSIQEGNITSLHHWVMGTHFLSFQFKRQLAITADAFWVGASSHQIYH